MEYVDLVNKIISAEHSAQDIAREVKEREETLDADLQRDVSEMREQYFSRAKRRIQQVRETEEAAAEENIALWDEKLKAAMAEVESAYGKNRDQWVDTLFRMITGGEP